MIINFPDSKEHVYMVAKAYAILSDQPIEDMIAECVENYLADMVTHKGIDLSKPAQKELESKKALEVIA